MNIEQVRFGRWLNGVIVVELEDEAARKDDLAAIVKLLTGLGAVVITKHIFSLPADGRCSTDAVQNGLAGIFQASDQAMVVTCGDGRISVIALLPEKTTGGVVVREK